MVLDGFVDWMENLCKSFFLFGKDKLFLLQINTICLVHLARGDLHDLTEQFYDKALGGVLLFICHDDFDVGAFFNLIVGQGIVSKKLIGSYRPKVREEQHAIKRDCQNQALDCQDVLHTCHFPPEVKAHKPRNQSDDH
jgi:hypothetical protein